MDLNGCRNMYNYTRGQKDEGIKTLSKDVISRNSHGDARLPILSERRSWMKSASKCGIDGMGNVYGLR